MTAKPASGFSLIELLIAMALGMILIMLAVPAYNTWTADTEVSTAAASIADGLRKANAEAIKRNQNVEFVLSPASGSGGWFTRVAGTAPTLDSAQFSQGAKRATFTTAPLLSTIVTFNPLGGIETANADASAPFTRVGIDVVGGSRPLTVLVGGLITGVKICNPKYAYSDTHPEGCP